MFEEINHSHSTGTTTTSRNTSPIPTAEEILDNVKALQEELYDEPPLIRVWIGDDKCWNKPLTEYPLIRENTYTCKPDDYYVVAGLGVFCGTNVYKKIWEIGFLAIWVEDTPG